MGRAAGIDYGFKRIGIALSDPSKIIASPMTTVATGKRLEETVQRLISTLAEHDVDLIIVGMPYRLDGSLGVMGDEIQRLITMLEKAQSARVIAWDERLTTVEAERALREGGMNRKKRSKVVDQISAAILLRAYLESVLTDYDFGSSR